MAIAKSKQWTEADVQAAMEVIKAVPGLWEELERIEKSSVIDRKTIEAGRREYDVLVRLQSGLRFERVDRSLHADPPDFAQRAGTELIC